MLADFQKAAPPAVCIYSNTPRPWLLHAWSAHVQTCSPVTPAGSEEKLPQSWKQSGRMEQRAGGVQPSHGLSRESGGAVQSAVQRPAVQHPAQRLPWPAGAAALQAPTSHGHRTEQNQWEDVGTWWCDVRLDTICSMWAQQQMKTAFKQDVDTMYPCCLSIPPSFFQVFSSVCQRLHQ